MGDSEKLDIIISELRGMKQDIKELKEEVQILKDDVRILKDDVQILKDDVRILKEDVKTLEKRTLYIETHIENGTDKNIQLIAENFIELTRKLDQAIPIADKNLAYEIKVNYLTERVDKLEKQVDELRSRTA